MKHQVLFSFKEKKKLKCRLLQFLFGSNKRQIMYVFTEKVDNLEFVYQKPSLSEVLH